MLLLGPERPDCDWNDPKLDKRAKGCRERAQFELGIKDKKNADAYTKHQLFACRSHAKDMFQVVMAPIVNAMHAIDPNVVMYIHDIDLANALRRKKGELEKKRLDAEAKAKEEFVKTGVYPQSSGRYPT